MNCWTIKTKYLTVLKNTIIIRLTKRERETLCETRSSDREVRKFYGKENKMSVKKTLKSESKEAVVYDVVADSFDEFLETEIDERIAEIDEYGPFSEKQMIPFITHKQNLPIYIILALCVIAHLWAYFTIE